MRATISLGRVGGVPFGAHWSALAAIVLLAGLLATSVLPAVEPGHGQLEYLLWGAGAAVAFLLALSAHEIAHAVVARRAGVDVRSITLWLLGGVSELAELPREPGAEARIAVVGPLTSLALGGAFLGTALVVGANGGPALLAATLTWLATMNIVLGVFNLLPGTPLDGGRVAHAIVWRLSGDRDRATRLAARAGEVLGTVLACLGILAVLYGRWDGLWLVLVGWFLSGSAVGEATHAALEAQLARVPVREVMSYDPVTVPGWWTVAQLVARLTAPDAPRHRHYPVVGIDGECLGVVGLRDLAKVPVPDRATTAVRAVATAVPGEWALAPDASLQVLADHPLAPGRDLAVVVAGGAVVGVVTAGDVVRTVELRAVADAERATR